ncbi:hypothetical protein SKAU_G00139280 [Synaphobranchus kaupii]|uniref:Uncharacterized protein n=1 Tax=Synaphobranchus kaupii TaxID=118154 RepID=A0A9Q1FSY4_SYNKA|nr:hypothetical protein SKAU_G00139280 [Synaphobranchus kaupii]
MRVSIMTTRGSCEMSDRQDPRRVAEFDRKTPLTHVPRGEQMETPSRSHSVASVMDKKGLRQLCSLS